MPKIDANRLNLEETVVQVARVSKVVKGGRRFSYRALIVVGDRAGHVGVGLGKAKEVRDAIKKGVEDGKEHLVTVPVVGTANPVMITSQFAATAEAAAYVPPEREVREERGGDRRGGRGRGPAGEGGGDRRGGSGGGRGGPGGGPGGPGGPGGGRGGPGGGRGGPGGGRGGPGGRGPGGPRR